MRKKKMITSETNLNIFKRIDGNRNIDEQRKRKVMHSIQTCGFIGAIVCNEKLEIIDGQARVEACKELHIPIDYIIEEGLTIDDCIEMNISGTPWKLVDYVNSYADRGNFPSYEKLKKFCEQSPYPFRLSCVAILGTEVGNRDRTIKNGTLVITDNDYVRGLDTLNFWHLFDDIKTNNREFLYRALNYCRRMDDVDIDKLVSKLHKFPRDFSQINSITEAIQIIEERYNYNNRGVHIYIETEYYKLLDENTNGMGRKAIQMKREM